jgi:hypothetical protein
MKEVRSRRKRNYEEPDACHLDKLTYEQVKRVPVKGDVFILICDAKAVQLDYIVR